MTRVVCQILRAPCILLTARQGQASTLGFIQVYNASNVNESSDPLPIPEIFRAYWSLLGSTWQKVWTYRRLYAAPPANPNSPAVGDFTVQNWDHGNDNSFSYDFCFFFFLFLSVLIPPLPPPHLTHIIGTCSCHERTLQCRQRMAHGQVV